MSNTEFNDDVYLQMARYQSNSFGFGAASMQAQQQNTGLCNALFGPSFLSSYQNNYSSLLPTKLDLAKKWLKDNGGAHPGCLDRFMQARGMACKS